MSDGSQKRFIRFYILFGFLFAAYIAANTAILLKLVKQESEKNMKAIIGSVDELNHVLSEINYPRLEKKILELKSKLYAQCERVDGISSHKNFAKLLFVVTKMKNSLLKEERFDNQISLMKNLMLGFDDLELENEVGELEGLKEKEVDTLNVIRLSFEKKITAIEHNRSTFFKKVISNWIRIKDKNHPLRVRFLDIEESIKNNDWENVTSIMEDYAHQEFKPLLIKFNDFVVACKNIMIIYRSLLQYISS